jgi:T3SS negative regulator,GrlR
MQDGLYKVSFQTPIGQGVGVVVIADGSVKGGDSGMYYTGAFQEMNSQFTGILRVGRHSAASAVGSVFGRDDIHIIVKGTSTDNSAALQGTDAEAPEIRFQALLTLIE